MANDPSHRSDDLTGADESLAWLDVRVDSSGREGLTGTTPADGPPDYAAVLEPQQ